MNYIKQTWNNLPTWTKMFLGTAAVWATMVNVGNALVAKRELDKGYKPMQADENMRSRLGQFYPRIYDDITYKVGKPGRKIIYITFG